MWKQSKKILNNQAGVALVIALLMMIVLTLIGLASVFTSSFEMRVSGNKRGSTDAFYSSDAGIQVVMANLNNFNVGNFTQDVNGDGHNDYDPFTDVSNPNPNNPTNAQARISHFEDQHGSPRGSGFSATNFEYEHFMINSVGQDQIELNPIRSRTTLEERVVRLVPTLQGGY